MSRLEELNNIMSGLELKIKSFCIMYDLTPTENCKYLHTLVDNLNNARIERDKLINF